jgi:hypothetical protein
MMIGGYPYLLNPSGMGGVYAAAVATQPVQPIAPVPGQTNASIIQFGGALSGLSSGGASPGGQTTSTSYAPGSTLDISV